MGSYLSEPITEKISTDESNDKLFCGASSMQGWRVSQEDAHNTLLDFDTNTAFFAVFDGHGGHEVAHYCAQKLPEFIKNTDAYKSGNIKEALIEGFLKFDATIATPEIVAILKEIAGEKDCEEETEDEEEENVNNLYEEASMPIEKVIEKYTGLVNPALKNLKKGDKIPRSPMIQAKRDDDEAGSSKSTTEETSAEGATQNGDVEPEKPSNGVVPEITVTKPEDKENSQNGEVINKDAKGKSPMKKTPNVRPKRNATQLYQKLLKFQGDSEEEEDTEDEEDKTFEEPGVESSDEEGVNTSIEVEASDEEGSSEGEDGEEEGEEEEEEDEADLEFARNMKEEPGSDSGCTAVVALMQGRELYVANAGDSRCIVCRNGKAVEMSFDHKPEDQPERERIVKAGGKVTADGRVNGGLNLSRAIGDHAYKQNTELGDREQMITALPDVKQLTINPDEDEFMVLACDGIWNFMSSQEVVDFVKPRLDDNVKPSTICEEMFDHCLAPNTMGDGTGCDNMTAIIVKFKPQLKKRSMSPEPDSKHAEEAKRAKTDDGDDKTDKASS